MLQAVIKNKLSRYLVQNGEPPEDLITDCFFGPLRYLDAQEAGQAIAWICQDNGRSAFPLLSGAIMSDIDLWPRSNRVEPDALMTCTSSSGTQLLLLIEVKWNSPLGQAQAVRQWREFDTSLMGAHRLLHLIVCRSRTSVEIDIKKQEEELWDGAPEELAIWRDSRLILTWYDVAKRLRDIPSGRSAQFQRWANDVRALLKKYGERPFEGFAHLPSFVMDPPAARSIFWTHKRTFSWPLMQVDQLQGSVFWQEENSRWRLTAATLLNPFKSLMHSGKRLRHSRGSYGRFSKTQASRIRR